ncbi:histidine kinase [Streptomyces sp. NPDC051079]|uniref:sensor histidine kinase n=1 Tax=Streptomyces sp. NPDC051079 TaxID=3155043 RepID=UPI00344E7A17
MRHPLLPPTRLVLADGALWAVLATVTGYGFRDAGGAASPVRDLVLPLAVLAVSVPLARTRPASAVLVVNGLCALGLADSATPANAHVLSLAALSCLLGVRIARARAALVVLAACLVVDVATCAVLRVPAVWWFYTLTVIPAALLLPWLVGRHWRGRRELVRGGWRLARSLEERQHLVAERARLTERADIAADMHDSLGHVLSLVALRAGALELSPDLTDRDRADLAELRGTIADAVEQLRQTVTVLHDPRDAGTGTGTVAGAGGLPVKDTVADLVARAAASGVPVSWEQRGPVPVLPPLVERGIYRVVREGLTNSVKHAPGSAVRIRIDHALDHTRVSVVNAARADARAGEADEQTSATGGRGLTGLRERMEVLGGALHTGPHQGGFRVTAVLPHQTTARPLERTAVTGAGTHTDHLGATESAERLAAVRRAARRRTVAAFAAPAAAAAIFLPAAAYLAWQLTTGVLTPSRFDALEPGRPRAELGRLLPARAFPYPPDDARSAPRPPGTDCDFYRSGRDLLHQVDLYRLCWSDGVLVAKDTLEANRSRPARPAETPHDVESPAATTYSP